MATFVTRFLPALDPAVRRAHRLEVRVRRPPQLGARVPAVTVRLALVVLGAGLSVLQLPGAFWITIGILLALVAGILPRSHGAWLLIVLLGLSEALLGAEHDGSTRALGFAGGSWRFFALLAGIHALALLGSLAIALPGRGSIQLRVLGRPALRFAVVQVAVQAAAALTFGILGSGRPAIHGIPVLALIAACGFAALVALLIAPLLRGRARE